MTYFPSVTNNTTHCINAAESLDVSKTSIKFTRDQKENRLTTPDDYHWEELV